MEINAAFIVCVILALLFGIVVGILIMYQYFMHIIIPETGKRMQLTNIPKKFARYALECYWLRINDFSDNLSHLDKIKLKVLNDNVLTVVSAYVEDPKDFLEEKQNGQTTV